MEESDEIIDDLLYNFVSDLIDSDDIVTAMIAESRGSMWDYDNSRNLETWEIRPWDDRKRGKIGFSVEIHLSGESDSEYPSMLTEMWVSIKGEAEQESGEDWTITDYTVQNAEFDAYLPENRDFEDAVLSNRNYFQTFSDEIANLNGLNDIVLTDLNLQQTLQRQIYISAITCLETYLSDALINKVLSTDEFLESFSKKFDFGDKKIPMNKLYDIFNKLDEVAKKELLELIYHSLSKIGAIYEKVLGVVFEKTLLTPLYKAVSTRHDLVHRNGKTKDGKFVEINKQIVESVINAVETFVIDLNEKMEKRISPDFDDIAF